MEPCETPALTGYPCEYFPSKTTRSRLLLRKEKIRLNIWPEIPRLKFVNKNSISKALEISSSTAPVAPDLLKALTIISDATVIKSVVHREDLKPYCKSEKMSHFPRWSTILSFTNFSRTLLTTERRLTGS